MANKKVTNWRKHMIDLLKDQLGRPVSVELLEESYPEIVNAMASGQPAPQVAQVLAAKIIKLAIKGDEKNQWAIEMIYDRVVGKPKQSPVDAGGGRQFADEKLDDVTTEHLNVLAQDFAATNGGLASPPPGPPDRQMASALVDVPDHGPVGSKDAGSEPEMA